jgi:hypothetical protein
MTYAPGQLHSVLWHGDGSYNVAKVLVVDDLGLHVRIYAEVFEDRPGYVPGDLEVGSPYDGQAFGVSHIPVTVGEFERWEPELLHTEAVEPAELDGYEHWRAEAKDTSYLGQDEPGVIGRLASRFKRG